MKRLESSILSSIAAALLLMAAGLSLVAGDALIWQPIVLAAAGIVFAAVAILQRRTAKGARR